MRVRRGAVVTSKLVLVTEADGVLDLVANGLASTRVVLLAGELVRDRLGGRLLVVWDGVTEVLSVDARLISKKILTERSCHQHRKGCHRHGRG